jgi:hypothetical protein
LIKLICGSCFELAMNSGKYKDVALYQSVFEMLIARHCRQVWRKFPLRIRIQIHQEGHLNCFTCKIIFHEDAES